jgi:hypothetical protein
VRAAVSAADAQWLVAGWRMNASSPMNATIMVWRAGQPRQRNQHFPSGPLIKAALIAGATAMPGVSRINGARLAPPPSQFQGFGRVNVFQTLPLAGGENNYRMQVRLPYPCHAHPCDFA